MATVGEILHYPPDDARTSTRMGAFMDWVASNQRRTFADYEELWRWSVEHLEDFWASIWSFFDVRATARYTSVIEGESMPDVEWFPGARLNYAEHALVHEGAQNAVIGLSETRARTALSRNALRASVARARRGLQRLGVVEGDRVAAYLPNIPEAAIAFLATASLGAIWTSCAPEFGVRSVIDRFRQVEPKVLFVIDGYRYRGRPIPRVGEVAEIRDAIPGLKSTIAVPYLSGMEAIADSIEWSDFLAEEGKLEFAQLPFEHPLVIVYSSGTTGLPKPIVLSHGGILLEHLKALGLHYDLGEGDTLFWFTTTSWIMWNIMLSALLLGASFIAFDGDPGYPDLMTLWRITDEEAVTYFGLSAGLLLSYRRAGLDPKAEFSLSNLDSVGVTGSYLPVEGYEWIYQAVKSNVVVAPTSGGTDVATGFVGAAPLLPVYAGEMACRQLACDVVALRADGSVVEDEQGELVVRRPMPSMPVAFWGDEDRSRLRDAYFAVFPGQWRHGDWITITSRGTCIISGRSDATLNRGGVRLGTAEFYSVVEEEPAIKESLVVNVQSSPTDVGELLLFVQLDPGHQLDIELRSRIVSRLRALLSPRHVPDDIIAVPAIPKTLTGKKLEVPVKRILQGAAIDDVASEGALQDPAALRPFVELAEHRGTRRKP